MARVILAAGLAVALANPAAAQLAEGWYLGAEAGLAKPRDATTTGGGASYATDYTTGAAVLGTAGYGFKPSGLARLRLEGEVGWRSGAIDSVNGGSGSGDADSSSLMANVVGEFLPDQRFHPFVGLGLGGAVVDSGATSSTGGFSGDDTVFAYQALAGIGFDVTPDVGLSVAYRYFATEDPALKTNTGAAAGSEYAAHTLTAGITFRFGGAPAPAASAAPPALAVAAPVVAPPPAPASVADTFRVPFDWNSAVITPAGQREVDRAAAAAKTGAKSRLELTGHTDRSGPDSFNMKLSMLRANAVKDALVRLGVQSSAISVVGKGERDPLVATKDGVREDQNRRVEIVLP